jgi:serine protease Do
MKQYLLKVFGGMVIAALISTGGYAQKDKARDKEKDESTVERNERVIIERKGDGKSKVTVEIKNGEVRVNGKPVTEFDDENLSVRVEKSDWQRGYRPVAPRSPFRAGGNAMIFRDDNRPLLGVMTDDHENGAKITAVTKGSAAEKAGLKVGDVIARVNDIKVENARELTEAVAKFKPEDKVTIGIKKADKIENVTATLGKRNNLFVSPDIISPDVNINMDNLDFNTDNFGIDGARAFNYNRGRLGIKAQDTEDEKGVKVLSVDPESHAAKSGIKEGDIIYQFDGEEVNSATELAEAAREAREKNLIKVRISRDGKSQDMEIKIPKKLKTANL